MKSIEADVAIKERPETERKEAVSQSVENAVGEERVAEKPKVSEEIMIEEINIDGMCGVY